MRKIGTASLALALSTLAFPVVAGDAVNLVASRHAGAPQFRIPMSTSQVADARMREVITERLGQSLDLDGIDIDMQRLAELAALNGAAAQMEDGEAMIVEASWQPDVAQSDPVPDMPLASAEILQSLSAEQIQAMTALMAMLQQGAAQAPISGSTEMPVRDVTLNAGANVLLRGWSVVMRPDGSTHLFQTDNPQSEIELEPGLVIGALGMVSDIRRIGPEVFVTFASGDTISGQAEIMPVGIPPLPPISMQELEDEVILLSHPVARAEHDPVELSPSDHGASDNRQP